MTALLVVAVALGLNNLAASVGIGMRGADRGTRLRVAAVFGAFETLMPLVGLLLGRGIAGQLGQAAHWFAAGLLIAAGGYILVEAVRRKEAPDPSRLRGWRLVAGGAALSLDNLAVGFALGSVHVPVAVAVIVVGVTSVVMSMIGLELGARIGTALGQYGEVFSGVVLICVGVVMALLPAYSGGRLPSSSRSNSPSLTPRTNASHSACVKYSLSPSGSAASNIT
jgi:manganese efflux pump family protein